MSTAPQDIYKKIFTMNKREVGQYCESYVCQQLEKHGFSIVVRNFRVGKGSEIDIVAQKDNVIHFIEVKARSNSTYGLPREAVTPDKLQRIIRASEFFTKQYKTYDMPRSYDIAEVYFSIYEQTVQVKKINFLFQIC